MSNFPEKIWFNGKIVPWAEANVHVMSHALHYGSSVFEGIRSYETPKGPAIFRLGEHTKRFFIALLRTHNQRLVKLTVTRARTRN